MMRETPPTKWYPIQTAKCLLAKKNSHSQEKLLRERRFVLFALEAMGETRRQSMINDRIPASQSSTPAHEAGVHHREGICFTSRLRYEIRQQNTRAS